ncbi:MAG: AIM24 family protein [Kiritimatiellae bacterium]|nr:AIM24 family protein [Kiritimatiellia bacterium]
MITMRNVLDNANIVQKEQMGCFMVLEHKSDRSVTPKTAMKEYFMGKMGFAKRQLLCELNGNAVKIQAGAMQWISGAVESTTGITGAGQLAKNWLKAAVTKESAVKPLYKGNGCVMLEPSYHYILLEDVASWGRDGIVLTDGMFLACDAGIQEKIIMRKNLSSVFGGKGLFNLSLIGEGVCALESFVPREELFEFTLENDVMKIDGNMAVCWSGSLDFTVERSSKTLLGSLVNGEGLVNVYRGTGKILMAPTLPGTLDEGSNAPKAEDAEASKGIGAKLLKGVSELVD